MWKLFCITLVAGFFGAEGWTVAEGAEPIDTLASIWESQQSEIVTAHIKCRLVRVGKDSLAPLSRQQVHEILAKLDPKNPSAVFKALADRALKLPFKSDSPGVRFEYLYEGTRYKELALSGNCQVFNGEFEATFDSANGNATVYAPGASRMGVDHLGDFRMVPNPKAKKDLIFVGRAGNRVELKAGRNPLIVDGATGVVYRYSHVGAKGKVTQETIKDCYVKYPGDIVFPSLSVCVRYDANETLTYFTARWVDAADFNRDLPKDAFTFPVPGNIVIFDKRIPGHLRSHRTQTAESDVFAAVKTVFDAKGAKGSGSPGMGPRSLRHGMWWSVGIGGAVVLLSLAGRLVIRKRFFTLG